MAKILIVDDEPALVRLMSQVLGQKGHEILTASGGQEALKLLFANKPDLVLLDVVMPGMDGWQVCKRIREVSDIPIVMLTGKHKSEEDIVMGLEYGADDYLLKPIGNKELAARVRAVLRRAEMMPKTEKKVVFNDDYLNIDVTERKVMVNGERIKLTPIEFSLLAQLLENAGRILTHRQILEKVWGWEYIDDVDYVRIYISHLRQKIEPKPNQPKYIMTESGVGYFFQKAAT